MALVVGSLSVCCAGPAAQLVAFKCFGGIVNLDPIGARHALALTVVAARKVLPASFLICQKPVLSRDARSHL